MCAMAHPGGGKNDIPERLKRHFVVVNCPMPSAASLDRISKTMVLQHYSATNGFSGDVVAAAEALPKLSQQLWRATKEKMLPTPSKFHYTFNLRDLSQILRGLMRGDSSVIMDPRALLNLWAHESKRVLSDRFTVAEDSAWFDNQVTVIAQQVLPQLAAAEGIEGVGLISANNVWCTFLEDNLQDATPKTDVPDETGDNQEEVSPESRALYRPAQTLANLKTSLEGFLARYNGSIRGPGLKLVFFDDAIQNISRIARILSNPGASAMLVGVGGSGKKSLTKLAAFIVGSQLFQIVVTRSYTISNLMDDLKIVCRLTGCEGKSVTFLLTDSEIRDESFLGYINALLTSGEIPGLFPKDEVLAIISELRPLMQAEKPDVPDSQENVWKFFLERIRRNLHMVLCFSPVTNAFRTRSLKFPALFSACTIIWLNPWPKQGGLLTFANCSNPLV